MKAKVQGFARWFSERFSIAFDKSSSRTVGDVTGRRYELEKRTETTERQWVKAVGAVEAKENV